MSISKKYRSYGIRRSNNLSDLNDKEQSLNNLLNDIQVRPGESFISQDLDAIRGLKNTEVIPDTFIQLAGTAASFSFANTLGPQEAFVEPYIRLQDRFNLFRQVTGNPGVLGSGMGPTAWKVPSSKISVSPVKGSNANTIISGFNNSKTDLIENNDYWGTGEFVVVDKFDLSFPDDKGGVIWEGFLMPQYSILNSRIFFETTGLVHIEVDRFNSGDWSVLRSIYAPTRTVRVEANTSSSVVVLGDGEGRFVAVGDKLTSNNDIVITDISGDVVTLSNDVILVANSNLAVTFDVGSQYITGVARLETAYDIGENFKVRFMWWYPNTTPSDNEKYLRFSYTMDSGLTFYRMSNTQPQTSDSQAVSLINDSISPFQSEYGYSASYKTYITSGVIRSTYTPPRGFSTVNSLGANTSLTINFQQNRRFFTGDAERLANTSIGHVIIDNTPSFADIQKFTQIKRNPSTADVSGVRIVSKQFPSSGPRSVKIVDHNGLMDYFITSTSNNIVTVDSTSRIRKGMVCVTYFTPSTPFVTITDVINSTSFSTSSSLGLSSNNYVFIYADSGLIDSSKDVFCAGVIGKLLTAPVSVGATTLTVSSNTDLSVNMRVQYSGALEPSANVRILAVGGNQITLNTPTTSAIDTGSTIVFAPSNSSGDKQQCILPLDLSPPFLGTNEGLDSRGKRIVPTVSANLHITTLALSSNSAVVSAANSTDVFDAALVINQIYRIKARQII